MDGYLPQLTPRSARWLRFIALAAALVSLGCIVLRLRTVLTPVAIGLALAYVLDPLITSLERRGVRRSTSILIGLGLLSVAAAFLLVGASYQVIDFATNVDDYMQRVSSLVQEWTTRFDLTRWTWLAGGESNATAPNTASAPVPQRNLLAQLAQTHGVTISRTIIDFVRQVVANVLYYATLAVLTPMFAFAFLLHFPTIVRRLHDHLPASYRPTVVRVAHTIDRSISNFFRGRLVACACVGALMGLGWLLVGVPYSLLLGALAGLFNLVPFLSVLALPPALILAYMDAAQAGSWLGPVISVFAVYALVQMIESFILSPWIDGRASGLHWVTIVIALMIGQELGGLLGMLLAIPIASTLKSLSVEYLLPEIRRLAQETPPPPASDHGAPQ